MADEIGTYPVDIKTEPAPGVLERREALAQKQLERAAREMTDAKKDAAAIMETVARIWERLLN